MDGRVLAPLHEQLRRVRSEPHLHALPVGALDDVQHGPLVEVRLGEDQLVGPVSLQDRRHLGDGAAEERQPFDVVVRDGPEELVADAAPRRTELRVQVRQARAVADEHDAPVDADALHHLERERGVRRPKQPDRQ